MLTPERYGLSFDPRSRAGSDRFGRYCGSLSTRFRSALPRGERRSASCVLWRRALKFRSALPRGERLAGDAELCGASALFRSALPRGERRMCFTAVGRCLSVSIRAPARGATRAR